MNKEKIRDYSVKISQSSKTELVVIMYEIAIEYIEEALTYYEDKDTDGYRNALGKARMVVQELGAALDMKYPVSKQLMSIYLFVNKALIRADMRNDMTELKRIEGIFERLRDTFIQISQSDTSGPVLENAQQVYAGMTYSKSSLNEDVYTDTGRGFTV